VDSLIPDVKTPDDNDVGRPAILERDVATLVLVFIAVVAVKIVWLVDDLTLEVEILDCRVLRDERLVRLRVGRRPLVLMIVGRGNDSPLLTDVDEVLDLLVVDTRDVVAERLVTEVCLMLLEVTEDEDAEVLVEELDERLVEV